MSETLDLPDLKEYPIAEAYPIAKVAIEEMAAEYMPLVVEQDGTGLKEVHAARIKVKNARIAVEKKRKELKADALAYGRKVDDAAKELFGMLEPIESHLTSEEKTYEEEKARIRREEEEARQQALKVKVDELAKYGHITTTYEVDAMTDTVYAATLEEAKQAHAEKLKREAEEKAEQERLEAERKQREAEEAAKLKAEREKLEAERKAEEARQAAEREHFALMQSRINELAKYGAIHTYEEIAPLPEEAYGELLHKAVTAYKTKQKAEAEARAAQEAEAERLRKEREAIEAEKARIAAEKEAAERKAEQERREKEAAERAAQAERERIAREQAEAKAQAEREEAERKRQEELRPDQEKIAAFADQVESLVLPLLSENSAGARQKVTKALKVCATQIRVIGESLVPTPVDPAEEQEAASAAAEV